MRGSTQGNCMTKCLLTISVCLGGLVLLAGCTGTQSAPQVRPQVVQPVQPPQEPNAAPEPNEVQPKEQSRGVEPNETIMSNIPEFGPTQVMQTGGTVKAEGLGDGEGANHRQAAIDDANRPAEDQGTGVLSASLRPPGRRRLRSGNKGLWSRTKLPPPASPMS